MKLGVIGAGAWGKNHIKTLHEMGVLGVIVEKNAELREKTSLLYPDIICVSSFEEVVERDELNSSVDGVVVATPANTHADVGVECLTAGKHVLVEKPMALSVREATRLVETAEDNKLTLMVGHLALFHPAIQYIKEALENREIGELYSVHQRRAKLGRARSTEDVLWSFGAHDIAVILFLTGESPESIHAMGHSGIQNSIADDVHLQMKFPSGTTCNLHSSWLWPKVERKIVAVGSKGILTFDELEQKVVLHRKTIDPDSLQNIDHGSSVVFEGGGQSLQLELQHFIDCCRSGKVPCADGRSGLEVVRVLEKATY